MNIIDLSLPLADGMPHFPGSAPLSLKEHLHLEQDGCRISVVVMGSHAGTHLDAPSHFLAEGRPVGELDLTRCVGDALVLDLSQKQPRDPITIEDLESSGVEIEPGARLLVRTGWDKQFGQPGYYTDYPPLAPKAADWLAAKRISLLGLDLPTLHPVEFAPMHRVLLGADVVIVESLANLDRVPGQRVLFCAAPLNLAASDGAPVRAIALVENGAHA